MVGYASFLFLSVAVGSSMLYKLKRQNKLKNELSGEYYVPVSIIVPAYNEEVYTLCLPLNTSFTKL